MEAIFLEALNKSITAGWLVLAVVVLRLLLKKAPRWISCLLWGLVAARLVCPFSMESALSLIPSSETISPDILYAQSPAIHIGIPALNSAVNPVISQSFAPNPAASANPLQIWTFLAAVVWLVGIAVMLLYTIISYLRLQRRVQTAVLLRENIWQGESIASPFVLGLVRPRNSPHADGTAWQGGTDCGGVFGDLPRRPFCLVSRPEEPSPKDCQISNDRHTQRGPRLQDVILRQGLWSKIIRYYRVVVVYNTKTSLYSLNFVSTGLSDGRVAHHKCWAAERVQAARAASWLELTRDLCP